MDNKFSDTINSVNGMFLEWDKVSPRVSFIHHNNIINDESMMDDPKHLNRKGFFTMVTNFKYVIYRILPGAPRSAKKSNNGGYFGGRSFRNGNSRGGGGRGRGGYRGSRGGLGGH